MSASENRPSGYRQWRQTEYTPEVMAYIYRYNFIRFLSQLKMGKRTSAIFATMEADTISMINKPLYYRSFGGCIIGYQAEGQDSTILYIGDIHV